MRRERLNLGEYSDKKIEIYLLRTLIDIIDYYPFIDKIYSEVYQLEPDKGDIDDLYYASIGEKPFKSEELKKCYEKYKEAIDNINQYSAINLLPSMKSKMDYYYYEYLKDHKEEINKVIALLDKLESLGFTEIYFDENFDFSKNIYQYILYDDSKVKLGISYLDNMYPIPNQSVNDITYATTSSNYRIVNSACLGYAIFPEGEIRDYGNCILLNSLVFDPNRLPNNVDKEFIINEILRMESKIQGSSTMIRNSAKMSYVYDNLLKQYEEANSILKRLENMDSDEIMKVRLSLLMIKKALEELKAISDEYDTSIMEKYPTLTRQLLKEVKDDTFNKSGKSIFDTILSHI